MHKIMLVNMLYFHMKLSQEVKSGNANILQYTIYCFIKLQC